MTKKQTFRAMQILTELNNIAHDMVTAREASHLCENYGVTNDKFRRVKKERQNFDGFNLAQVAVEIAKKEVA
jgi:hypothetical protein